MKLRKLFILIAFMGCSVAPLIAQPWEGIIQPSSVQTNAFVTVYDDKIDNANPNLGWESGHIPGDHNIFDAKGTVKLFVDKSAKLNIPSRISYEFNLMVEYVGESADINDMITDNIQLNVEYDPAAGTNYLDIALKQYDDVHWMKVTVTSITDLVSASTVTDVEDLFKLSAAIAVTRYDDFDPSGDLEPISPVCDAACGSDGTCANPCDFINVTPATIEFTLPSYLGAEYLDLEWTWVDPNKIDGNGLHYTAGLNALTFSFENNATRVRVGADRNSYTIANIFREGYIAYRYRVWGRSSSNSDYQSSEWMPKGKAEGDIFAEDYADAFIDEISSSNAHEIDKNWQFVTTFAEDGKRREVITYYDGLNKDRQAVTQFPSDGTTLVGQTIYDHEGRPAVQILPVPIENKTDLDYEEKANQAFGTTTQYSADDFDGQSSPTPLSDANGAGRYYSPANNLNHSHKDFIPDAQGYPFKQTVYTQDQSGRILFQSSVGGDHRIGSGYETEFQYGKPNHVDLAALFGDEVGKASHYKESIVIDANGQMSVSYIDQHGRVIATSLSGADVNNLENLSSAVTTPNSEVHPMHQANQTRIPEAHPFAYELTYPYVSKSDEIHSFWYEFQPEDYLLNCNSICFDCFYDLEIKITAEDGTVVYEGTKAFGPLNDINDECEANNVLTMWSGNDIESTSFQQQLSQGKYYIYKKLEINTSHVSEYWDLYLANEESCLNDYEYFYGLALGQVADCDELEGFPDDQGSAQCNAFHDLMIADFTPGGQYAKTDDTKDPKDEYNEPLFAVSIFNDDNELKKYKNKFWGTISEAKWNEPFTEYLDEQGVKSEVNDGEGRWLYPEELASYKDIAAIWKTSYSESLLPFHPEYPYYHLMCKLPEFESTFQYDSDVLDVETMAEAKSNDYIDPSDWNSIADNDPIITDMDFSYWDQVIKDIMYDVYGSVVITTGAQWDTWYNDHVKEVLNDAIRYNQTELDDNGVSTQYHLKELAVKIQCMESSQNDYLGTWSCEDLDGSYFDNANFYTEKQRDEQWQIYAKLYISKKGDVIYDILNDLVQALYQDANGNPYTNTNIGVTSPYEYAVPHFTYGQLFNLGITNSSDEEVDITEEPSDDDMKQDMIDVYNKELEKRATSVCAEHVQKWIYRINNCPHLVNNIVNGNDMSDLEQDLLNVCLNSYNPDRLMGGREDDPNSDDIVQGAAYSSLQDVLEDYFGVNYETTYCNLDVFDEELVMNGHPLMIHEVKKEEDCSCEYLENLVVETIEEEVQSIRIKDNCDDNIEWVQSLLSDLVLSSAMVHPSTYYTYTTLDPAVAPWTYNSHFATIINVDISQSPSDRIEYLLNDFGGTLAISFRKVGTTGTNEYFTVKLSNWPSTITTLGGGGAAFTRVRSGGDYPCISCTNFNILYDGKLYTGQISELITTCDRVRLKTVIEKVTAEYYHLEGTTLSNGDVLMLMEACDATKALIGELDHDMDVEICTNVKYIPSITQEIMIAHLDEVSRRTGPEIGATQDYRSYNCLPGPYYYCPDNNYDVYKQSLLVDYHPFNNYVWSTTYDQNLYDPDQRTTSAEFFFGSRFKTYCSDGVDVEYCYASLAYFDVYDAANPIADRSHIVKIEGPFYDYTRNLWTAQLTIDDGVSAPYSRNMHFITCNQGSSMCIETEWLELTFKGTCTEGDIESSEDFDYLCDCEQPKFDEFFNELKTNGALFDEVNTTDVSTYTAVSTNESTNHLKLYNSSTLDYEYIMLESDGTVMKSSFGDLDGSYCNLYMRVPEGETFTLHGIVSFDDTRLNTDMMDMEVYEGVTLLTKGSAHYIIDVTIIDPVANPIAPHWVSKEIYLYSNCYLTPCAVFNSKDALIPEHIRAEMPCPDCVDCVDLKTEMENFVAAYPSIGYNHALFPSFVTRYLNTAFATNRAFPEYQEYISNCKLAADATPGYTDCHLSFSLTGTDVTTFNANLSAYAASFETVNTDFIQYKTVTTDYLTYDYCFDFSNLSPELAGIVLQDLAAMEYATNTEIWSAYPTDVSANYPYAKENSTGSEVHKILFPNITTDKALILPLGTAVSNAFGSQVAFSVVGNQWTAWNGSSTPTKYRRVELDYSGLTDAEDREELIQIILEVLDVSNTIEVHFGSLYYAYQNTRHEDYEICDVPVTECETCDDIRDVVLDFVYAQEGEIELSRTEYINQLEASIDAEFSLATHAKYAIDDCETCSDRDLYICDELSTNAVDLLEWMNDMASTDLTLGTSLSSNSTFLNASFYPNTSTDNPTYAASVNAAGTEITMQVSDALAYELNVVVYSADASVIDFSKVSSFESVEIIPNTRGANYHFKAFAHNTVDDEIYVVEGHVDAFAMAACCYFDDLDLCYRTQMPSFEWKPEPCEEYRHRMATLNAERMYKDYISKEKALFEEEYREACAGAFSNNMEKFQMKAPNTSHQYTLHYFDQAGNLVQTVPPKGVKKLSVLDATEVANRTHPNNHAVHPNHELNTFYQYNSMDQPVWRSTPDGGEVHSFYDKLGRVVFSQNAKQAAQGHVYSYTSYDPLGRIVEYGETDLTVAVVQATFYSQLNYAETLLSASSWKRQVVYIKYDETFSSTVDALFGSAGQEYLRNKVASEYYKNDAADAHDYDYASHYGYDVHGFVRTIIRDYPELSEVDAQYKRIDFEYDLISGNMNMVYYQKDEADQFIHRYTYDDDNIVILAETSRDGIIFDRDVRYNYHYDGPLARTELGDNDVQGLDYTYTIQNWAKGLNAATLEASRDPGSDNGSDFARDAVGYGIHYYDNDYLSIGSTSFSPANGNSSFEYGTSNLYNGQVSSITTGNRALLNDGKDILGQNFYYDQLNRLVESKTYLMDGASIASNSWNGVAEANKWRTEHSYDANGNLTQTFRSGHKPIPTVMDDLEYHYYPESEKLKSVEETAFTHSIGITEAQHDALFASNDGGVEDINHGQDVSGGNYFYDEIGNLTSDLQEEIASIEWNLKGKVSSVTRTPTSIKPDIEIAYNTAGQRIKKLIKYSDREIDWKSQYYVHNGSGQVMAVYEKGLQLGEDALNFEAMGDWIELNAGGQSVVIDLIEAGYADHETFKDRLITELLNSGLEQLVASNYTLAQIVGWENSLSKDIFQSYDDDPSAFDFMLDAMISNTTFKSDFIDGLWSSNGILTLEVMLVNDLANDYLHCFTLTELNQFVTDLYTGPPSAPSFGTKMDAINHLKNNHTDNEIATHLYNFFAAGSKSALKNCVTNTLLTSMWTHLNFQALNPGMATFLDGVVLSLDETDLATWFISDPDAMVGRAYNYLVQNGTPYFLLSGAAANDGVNFVGYGLNALPIFDVLYTTLLPGLDGYNPNFFSLLIQQELGVSVYNSMMDDLVDDFVYLETFRLIDLPIYGNIRHGSKQEDLELTQIEFSATGINGDGSIQRGTSTVTYVAPLPGSFDIKTRILGTKQYELTNHLGNVLATVTDRRVLTEDINDPNPTNWWWDADVVSAQDYYPFGMLMPDRTYENGADKDYRYGFSGMEKDDEWNGSGNTYDFGARIYDCRVGRWLARDPEADKYPAISPYVYALNSPLLFTDPNGKWVAYVHAQPRKNGTIKYTMRYKAEAGDNLTTLSTQLGIKEKAIVTRYPDLKGMDIKVDQEFKMDKLLQVQEINNALGNQAFKAHNGTQKESNCANFAATATCKGDGVPFERDENGEGIRVPYGKVSNVEIYADKLKKEYVAVTEENASVGTVIHYRLNWTDDQIKATAHAEAVTAVRAHTFTETGADLVAAQQAMYDSEFAKQKASLTYTRDNERHFSVVVLKSKDGKAVTQVVQKQGQSDFKFKTEDPVPDQYEIKPVEGTSNSYYKPKNMK